LSESSLFKGLRGPPGPENICSSALLVQSSEPQGHTPWRARGAALRRRLKRWLAVGLHQAEI